MKKAFLVYVITIAGLVLLGFNSYEFDFKHPTVATVSGIISTIL